METKRFYHQCGRVYNILKQSGYYTLLEGVKDYIDKYLVVWLLDETTGTWGQGYYFEKECHDNAFKLFDKKSSRGSLMLPEIYIRGHNIKDLTFIGYWDQCLFKQNKDDAGVIVQTKSGEKLYLTYNEINKVKRRATNDC